jgi:Cu2+-containing amine oxidase
MIGTEQPGQPVAYQFMRQDVLLFVLPEASVSNRAVFITKLSRVRPYHSVYAYEAYLSKQIMVDWQRHRGRCSKKTRSLEHRG